MRTDRMRESENVQDRRGVSPGVMVGGGLGGLGLIIVLVVALLGGNPQQALQQIQQQQSQQQRQQPSGPGTGVDPNDPNAILVKKVLGDTEDVWTKIFAQAGKRYQPAPLVLFTDRVHSKCGGATAASGPFYCPGDSQVYIDLAFYRELSDRFGAPGDFAQAYVIAHEVGHHIQNLLGISEQMQAQHGRISEEEYNKLSVRLELQADFFAGVWAHHANKERQILEAGDVEEAMRCAAAIGDDRIQKQAQGYVVPESFTHGSSAQRVAWFKKGLLTGDINQGDTFSLPDP